MKHVKVILNYLFWLSLILLVNYTVLTWFPEKLAYSIMASPVGYTVIELIEHLFPKKNARAVLSAFIALGLVIEGILVLATREEASGIFRSCIDEPELFNDKHKKA